MKSDKKMLFQSRDEYRKARLEKIMKAKEKPVAPTIDELKLKPSLNETRQKQLVKRDESIRAQDANKDSYI